MAAPPVQSKAFAENPPSVDPKVVSLKVPCRGRDDESFNITILNPNNERCTFKVKGTKLDKFIIEPGFGFVDGKSSKNIECQPKKITEADGFNRFDHFSICVAPAPAGELLEAKDVWKAGGALEPKQVQRYKVGILCEEKPPDAPAE